ncbi:hypothetical protein CHGG_05053 [Chaetomium globosum CBS 148.51]|uniref:Uncharacterized protein n=1 Tax=Chaetomium globosum (strain ATCC 6205 / CBS 148.51 / DSM 1962 / NBRC 6347 / NRRL 1970) TaxID=306901 RepID=Q2GZJ3_CHAGB|nr:uncharacterized protein CHGG_05053 [Chaetomium globosum CBS 148.51]EAQ88434.1 hypothetical protein CHGG_05053 [Chaetomium globosum CBS 148.51]
MALAAPSTDPAVLKSPQEHQWNEYYLPGTFPPQETRPGELGKRPCGTAAPRRFPGGASGKPGAHLHLHLATGHRATRGGSSPAAHPISKSATRSPELSRDNENWVRRKAQHGAALGSVQPGPCA